LNSRLNRKVKARVFAFREEVQAAPRRLDAEPEPGHDAFLAAYRKLLARVRQNYPSALLVVGDFRVQVAPQRGDAEAGADQLTAFRRQQLGW
jgi:hypothetical protein